MKDLSHRQRGRRTVALLLTVTLGAAAHAAGQAAAAEPTVPPSQTAASARVIRDLEYVRRDDIPMRADLYLPPQQPTPCPAVLMVHGGAWFTGRKEQMSWHARRAVQRGIAALSIDYRLAPLHPFPAQLEDVRAALAWLVKHGPAYGIDPQRVGVFGYSAGGHLACLLAATDRETTGRSELRAVVAGGAPCDFSWIPTDSRRLAYWLGGSPAQVPTRYRQATPLNFVSADDPPVFFFHGQADQLVPLASPQRMARKLTELGVFCQLYIVPGKGHLLAFVDPKAVDRALEFLDKRLRATAGASRPDQGPGPGRQPADGGQSRRRHPVSGTGSNR